jgi:hypothetical protein
VKIEGNYPYNYSGIRTRTIFLDFDYCYHKEPFICVEFQMHVYNLLHREDIWRLYRGTAFSLCTITTFVAASRCESAPVIRESDIIPVDIQV